MTTEQRLERLERENRWMRRIGAVDVAVAVCSLLACSYHGFDPAATAKAQCRTLHNKAMHWKMIKRKPPDSLDEMVAPLTQRDDENFLESVPEDPWGNPYVLVRDGKKFHVYSWGEDGQRGTKDDIVYAPPQAPR